MARRYSDAELAEMRANAKEARERARVTATQDPDYSRREYRFAEMTEANIRTEMSLRRR
jgi:hypothetical protein